MKQLPEHFFEALAACVDAPKLTHDDVDDVLFWSTDLEDICRNNVVCVARIKDGQFLAMEAWCDMSGWDWGCGGTASFHETLSECLRLGLSDEGRRLYRLENPE